MRQIFFTIIILAALFRPALADDTVKTIRGTALIKKTEATWHTLRDGEVLQAGDQLWLGTSTAIIVVSNEQEFEISGSGEDVFVIGTGPLQTEGGMLRYAGPPSVPVISSPPSGHRYISGSAELTWKETSRGYIYRVQVSTNLDFTKPLVDEKTDLTVKIMSGLPSSTYYWRVSAINRDGREGNFSNARSFLVKPIPAPPLLSPPASTTTSITFRWKSGGENEKYHLQISKDKGFSNTIVNLVGMETPRLTVGMMDAGTYYVRVSAADDEGLEGRFSEPMSFYVRP